MELGKQGFQFELFQVGAQQAYQLQRVEIHREERFHLFAAQVSGHIFAQDVVIIVGVVSKQYASLGIIKKTADALGRWKQRVVFALFDDGVDHVAQHVGNLPVGLQVYTEIAPFDHLASMYLAGGNLQDIIVEDVESCGLCVKHYDVLGVAGLNEFGKISAVGIEQHITWHHGVRLEFLNEGPARSRRLQDAQSS